MSSLKICMHQCNDICGVVLLAPLLVLLILVVVGFGGTSSTTAWVWKRGGLVFHIINATTAYRAHTHTHRDTQSEYTKKILREHSSSTILRGGLNFFSQSSTCAHRNTHTESSRRPTQSPALSLYNLFIHSFDILIIIIIHIIL